MSSKHFKREFCRASDFDELVPLCSTCGLLIRTNLNINSFIEYTKQGWKPDLWHALCQRGRLSWCCAKHFLELV